MLRAWHPASGSQMRAEVVATVGVAPCRSLSVIPDGLCERVLLREGPWIIVLEEEEA
jgi:hypothetical protein